MENWKNHPKKLLRIGQTPFSHCPAQATANSPKLIFHVMKFRDQTSVLLSVMLCWPVWWKKSYLWCSVLSPVRVKVRLMVAQTSSTLISMFIGVEFCRAGSTKSTWHGSESRLIVRYIIIQNVPAFHDFWFHWVIMKCGDHETIFRLKPQNGSKHFQKSTFWAFFQEDMMFFSHSYTIFKSCCIKQGKWLTSDKIDSGDSNNTQNIKTIDQCW